MAKINASCVRAEVDFPEMVPEIIDHAIIIRGGVGPQGIGAGDLLGLSGVGGKICITYGEEDE